MLIKIEIEITWDVNWIERYTENFLSEVELEELSIFLHESLDAGKFHQENGRSTLTNHHGTCW